LGQTALGDQECGLFLWLGQAFSTGRSISSAVAPRARASLRACSGASEFIRRNSITLQLCLQIPTLRAGGAHGVPGPRDKPQSPVGTSGAAYSQMHQSGVSTC
jgi:hypothetical protein